MTLYVLYADYSVLPDKAIRTLNEMTLCLFLYHFSKSSLPYPLHHNCLFHQEVKCLSTHLRPFQLAGLCAQSGICFVFFHCFSSDLALSLVIKTPSCFLPRKPGPPSNCSPHLPVLLSEFCYSTLSLLSCLSLLLGSPRSHSTHCWKVSSGA